MTTSESSSAFEVETSSVLASISRRYLDSGNESVAEPGLSSPLENSEPQQATLKLRPKPSSKKSQKHSTHQFSSNQTRTST